MRATVSYDQATNKLSVTGASASEMGMIWQAIHLGTPDYASDANVLVRLGQIVHLAWSHLRVAA